MMGVSKLYSGSGIPARTLLAAVLLIPPAAFSAHAQQTTSVPGSPSATRTIPGNQLPSPPPPFRGKIERNAAQSTPYWPARVVPPKGAPNVLLFIADDISFDIPSTCGGLISLRHLSR